MHNDFKKDMERLNDLIQKNLDAEKGYEKAAENVENDAVKIYFETRSRERGQFAQRLQNEVTTHWKDVEKDDSFASKAHRAWMDVKVFFSGDSEEAMLEEAIRGEEAALKEYDEILNDNNFSPATRGVLNAQRTSIQNALNEVRDMEKVS